ncbi:tRNA pseudouridine38/39 synthase [Spironucleus salmonicida]|nr:tRNA pseudouridine38/39 synthase [Spironucleus salmonicida]
MKRNKIEIANQILDTITKLPKDQQQKFYNKLFYQIRNPCIQTQEDIHCQPIVLKVSYDGQYLSGVQECNQPFTITRILKDALINAQMLPSNIHIPITSCGRTDSGVSASGQTFSLWIRAAQKTGATFGDMSNFIQSFDTIDYMNAINPKLPPEVQITGWALVQPKFSARHSTTGRTYSYFIPNFQNISIDLMRDASQKLIGWKNYKNFCFEKQEIDNYTRKIRSFDFLVDENTLQIRINGTAFLYHQIRCIISILVLIGLKLETLDIIDYLLDIETIQTRPKYIIAPPEFLLFEKPEYQDIVWNTSTKDKIIKNIQALKDMQTFTTQFYNLQKDTSYNYIIDQIKGNQENYCEIKNLK